MTTAGRLPMARLMRLGLGVLGWTPATFWSATPDEMRAALEGRFGRRVAHGGAAVARGDFEDLKRRFPDGASR